MTSQDSIIKQRQQDHTQRLARGQVMTPVWVAEALVDQYFGHLGPNDVVLEPSCGQGAFLRAIPHYVPAFGVEIDAALAAQARTLSNREVIVGDFSRVDIPIKPTCLIGNPPFELAVIERFLGRAYDLLEEDGTASFILPCFALQTAGTIERMSARWSISQDMIPRNCFMGLSKPLCFARFTKGTTRGLVGFALYHDTAAINRLRARYKALLANGEGNVWTAVVRAAMETLGGTASLQDIYREIAGNRPTEARTWHAKVRQQVQRIALRVSEGVWQLPDFEPRQLRLVA